MEGAFAAGSEAVVGAGAVVVIGTFGPGERLTERE